MPNRKVSPGQETQGDCRRHHNSHWGRYRRGDGKSGPGEQDVGEPGPERTQTVLVEEEGCRGGEGRGGSSRGQGTREGPLPPHLMQYE